MIFGDKYNFLVPPKEEVARLRVDSNYIRQGAGQNGRRRIYKNQIYDAFEQDKLTEFKAALDSIPVEYNKNFQNDSVLLRFLYANKFDIHFSVQHFIDHLGWLADPDSLDYNEDIAQFDKMVQVVGRDEMMRPILYINGGLMKEVDDPILITRNIILHMVIMEEYMFVPGKIESWIATIDLNTPALKVIGFEQVVYCAKLVQINFPQCLERLYILDAPIEARMMFDSLKEPIDGAIVLSEELLWKIEFVSRKEFDSLPFKFFQWADLHKQVLKKEEEVQTKQVKVFPYLMDEQPVDQHQHGFGEWDDCELCRKRNLRLQNLKKPPQIDQSDVGTQQALQQPLEKELSQIQPQIKSGEIVGPLYPMVVYAVGPPVNYNPKVHDQLLAKQKPVIQNTFFLDTQQRYPIVVDSTTLVRNNTPASVYPQGTYPEYTSNHMSGLKSRTKYDDMIDQFGWNKYGHHESPIMGLETLKHQTDSAMPNQNTEETLKQADYPRFVRNNTAQFSTENHIGNYQAPNPTIQIPRSPSIQPLSPSPLQTQTSPPIEPSRKPDGVGLKPIQTFEEQKYEPRLDPKYDLRLDPKYDLKLDPKYDLKLNPKFDPQQETKFDPKLDYQKEGSLYLQPLRTEYAATVDPLYKKYEFPLANQVPATTALAAAPQTTLAQPLGSGPLITVTSPVSSYEPLGLNYPSTQPRTQPYYPATNNQFEMFKPINYDEQFRLPKKETNVLKFDANQYDNYGAKYSFPTQRPSELLPQQVPTSIPVQSQNFDGSYVRGGTNESQFIPAVVEKDGLKHQDETFIVGEKNNQQYQRKNMQNETQCALF